MCERFDSFNIPEILQRICTERESGGILGSGCLRVFVLEKRKQNKSQMKQQYKHKIKYKLMNKLKEIIFYYFHSVWFSQKSLPFPWQGKVKFFCYHSTTEFLTTLCTGLCSNSLQNFWDIECIESFTYRGDTKNIFYKYKNYFISSR